MTIHAGTKLVYQLKGFEVRHDRDAEPIETLVTWRIFVRNPREQRTAGDLTVIVSVPAVVSEIDDVITESRKTLAAAFGEMAKDGSPDG